jgi:hypothetical protein
MNSVTIPFMTITPGDFTLPHTLGSTPDSVIIEMITSGIVWFQDALYDANNIYLVASDEGIAGYLIVRNF